MDERKSHDGRSNCDLDDQSDQTTPGDMDPTSSHRDDVVDRIMRSFCASLDSKIPVIRKVKAPAIKKERDIGFDTRLKVPLRKRSTEVTPGRPPARGVPDSSNLQGRSQSQARLSRPPSVPAAPASAVAFGSRGTAVPEPQVAARPLAPRSRAAAPPPAAAAPPAFKRAARRASAAVPAPPRPPPPPPPPPPPAAFLPYTPLNSAPGHLPGVTGVSSPRVVEPSTASRPPSRSFRSLFGLGRGSPRHRSQGDTWHGAGRVEPSSLPSNAPLQEYLALNADVSAGGQAENEKYEEEEGEDDGSPLSYELFGMGPASREPVPLPLSDSEGFLSAHPQDLASDRLAFDDAAVYLEPLPPDSYGLGSLPWPGPPQSPLISQPQPSQITETATNQEGLGLHQSIVHGPQDGADGDGRRKKAKRSLAESPAAAPNEGKKFACPYFKRNPKKYQKWTSCPGPGWVEVHRVKTHLYRRHACPIQCPRCWEVFKSDSQFQTHLQQEPPCRVQVNRMLHEGFTKDQEKKLRSRKKTHGDMTDMDKWREIYGILFPDDDPSAIPSPYYSESDDEADSRMNGSGELEDYATFIRREMPTLVRRELEILFHHEYQDVEKRIRPRIAEMVLNLQPRLLSLYKQSQMPLSEYGPQEQFDIGCGGTPSLQSQRTNSETGTEAERTPANASTQDSFFPFDERQPGYCDSVDLGALQVQPELQGGAQPAGVRLESDFDWDSEFDNLLNPAFFMSFPEGLDSHGPPQTLQMIRGDGKE